MSKPKAFGLFQLVWHFLKRFWHFFTSGLAFSVHLDLATLFKAVVPLLVFFHYSRPSVFSFHLVF